jgi:hypothetical protein
MRPSGPPKNDPFKSADAAIKRSAVLKTRRLGRLAGVRVARAAHDDAEPCGMDFIHPGNPSTTRATPRDLLSKLRWPPKVNIPICGVRGVGKQCGERRAAAHISPSENNHDLEPIRRSFLPVTFSPSPANPVDDRCRIGQYLNRVKGQDGECGTVPPGLRRGRYDRANGGWQYPIASEGSQGESGNMASAKPE